MASLAGSHQHTIDDKGRLFIPSKLREELGGTFHLAMGLDESLTLYSQQDWDSLTAKAAELPASKARKLRSFFANAGKCETDAQGRILVPQKLRAYAGLEKEVVINGFLGRAEIWSAERWSKMEDLSSETLLDAMDTLGL